MLALRSLRLSDEQPGSRPRPPRGRGVRRLSRACVFRPCCGARLIGPTRPLNAALPSPVGFCPLIGPPWSLFSACSWVIGVPPPGTSGPRTSTPSPTPPMVLAPPGAFTLDPPLPPPRVRRPTSVAQLARAERSGRRGRRESGGELTRSGLVRQLLCPRGFLVLDVTRHSQHLCREHPPPPSPAGSLLSPTRRVLTAFLKMFRDHGRCPPKPRGGRRCAAIAIGGRVRPRRPGSRPGSPAPRMNPARVVFLPGAGCPVTVRLLGLRCRPGCRALLVALATRSRARSARPPCPD